MTLAELRKAIDEKLPDNNQQAITPAVLRAVLLLLLVLALAEGVDS